MRIHFAHDSRHPDAAPSVISQCPFNSTLAIALMARHVAKQLKGSAIRLPDLHIRVDYGCIHEDFIKVTNETRLRIDDVETEVNTFGSTYDLRLTFGKHNLLIWLLYKDRPLPGLSKDHLMELGTTGLLCLDLTSFDQKRFATEKVRFSEAVKAFLLSDGRRRWVYHPKAESAVDNAKKSHLCSRRTPTSGARRIESNWERGADIDRAHIGTNYGFSPPRTVTPVSAKYQCVLCKTEWVHSGEGAPECPEGHGHLYSRKLG